MRQGARGSDLLIRTTNARGNPTGESNRLCVYTDQTVSQARAMRDSGATYKQIADALGVPRSTAWRWFTGKTRRPAVSIRVVRAKAPLQSNRQRQGRQSASPPAHTVGFTDAEYEALCKLHSDIA